MVWKPSLLGTTQVLPPLIGDHDRGTYTHQGLQTQRCYLFGAPGLVGLRASNSPSQDLKKNLHMYK